MRLKADLALGLAKEITPFKSRRINPSPTRGTGSKSEPASLKGKEPSATMRYKQCAISR